MTERHAGYVVTLEENIREDDAAEIMTAIRLVRGVAAVSPVLGSPEIHIAEERAKWRLRQKILDLFNSP